MGKSPQVISLTSGICLLHNRFHADGPNAQNCLYTSGRVSLC